MKRLVLLRRASQAFFLFVLLYIIWTTARPIAGLFHPKLFFVTNPNLVFFTSLSGREIMPGILLSLSMLGLTVCLGRFFCGWICPLGSCIDISGHLAKRSRWLKTATGKARHIKYFILLIIAVSAAVGTQVAWVMDPIVIVARFISLNLLPLIVAAVKNTFIFAMKDMKLHAVLYDVYNSMKPGISGLKIYFFYTSPAIFFIFLFTVLLSLAEPRFWCRTLCPLGGIYACVSRLALLRRKTGDCSRCGTCYENCRMGAINSDLSYRKEECVLCMDCIYDCPEGITRFSFPDVEQKNPDREVPDNGKGMSRKDFLFFIACSFMLFRAVTADGMRLSRKNALIRPPGVKDEEKLKIRCVRCGNCMKVCPTNVIQPAVLQSGPGGIWTPHLINEIGYCEYNCVSCGKVCPTGAIPELKIDEKKITKLGTARVYRRRCLAWEHGLECLVCEGHCPVPQKAIKVVESEIEGRKLGKPLVDEVLCIGCGICQNKCPARPLRAINVDPLSHEPDPV